MKSRKNAMVGKYVTLYNESGELTRLGQIVGRVGNLYRFMVYECFLYLPDFETLISADELNSNRARFWDTVEELAHEISRDYLRSSHERITV